MQLVENGAAKQPTTHFEPLGSSVVIDPIDLEEQTKGGVFIPQGGRVDRSADFRRARVVAVGPGNYTDKGERIPLDVKPGDTVLYSHGGSSSLDNIGGVQTGLRILPYQTIACIVREVEG